MMMINKKFNTSKKLDIKDASNEAMSEQTSSKGLLDNSILGEFRG